MRIFKYFSLFIFFFSLSCLPVYSHEVSGPKGAVILTLTGNIHHTNRPAINRFNDAFFVHHERQFDSAYAFDVKMLQELPQHKIRAHAEGWPKEVEFEGPRLEDVLKRAGAMGGKYRLMALDGYSSEISLKELEAKNWVLALKADNRTLGIGGRGPLWLVYETRNGKANADEESKWVWSVFLIEVE